MTETDKADAHRYWNRRTQSGRSQHLRILVDREGGNQVTGMVCRQQEACAWIDANISRRSPAGLCVESIRKAEEAVLGDEPGHVARRNRPSEPGGDA